MANTGCKIPVGLVRALEEARVSPTDVLSAARLPSRLLDLPGERVPVPEYFALWQAIGDISRDPDIGIKLATSVRPDLTEPLFLAILSTANITGALDVLSRYKRLLNPETIDVRVDEAKKLVVVTYEWPPSDRPLPQVLLDAELAFIVEMGRRGTRALDLAPRALHLRTTSLPAGAGHAAFFRCPIHLGADANAVAFDVEDCDRPFLTWNPQLSSALLPYLQANTPASPRSAIGRVRSVIAERLRGRRPTLGTVGKHLAMSQRTLQRLLKDNGTSFRELLDDVRNDHARGYLTSTSFTDIEIAFLLGFEDPNSFYRAFRSWNGVAPSEYRKRPLST